MPTIVKTDSGNWKAVIRKTGFPTATKTFRLKRDAEDWARRAEDEMVRGLYIKRAPSERLLFGDAIDRYLLEVTPTKRPFTQQSEKHRGVTLKKYFGKYSLAGITGSSSRNLATSALRDSIAWTTRGSPGRERPTRCGSSWR
jgi:hypothetical protein